MNREQTNTNDLANQFGFFSAQIFDALNRANEQNEEIEEKRKDIVWLATEKAKLENYVMRLEEAGNQLKDRYILENENWDLKTVNDWNKAKEDKP